MKYMNMGTHLDSDSLEIWSVVHRNRVMIEANSVRTTTVRNDGMWDHRDADHDHDLDRNPGTE